MFITISFLDRGLDAISNTLFESLSVLASSTGPKTLLRSLALFVFFVLERRPLAIPSAACCVLRAAVADVEFVSKAFQGGIPKV